MKTKSFRAALAVLSGRTPINGYRLEYLTTTTSKTPGEAETIYMPYAELGRDTGCLVRFDKKEASVSRKHAAIIHRDKDFLIQNLSRTNQTLVNGRPVNKEWNLKDGDEIQLSSDGPKLKFHADAGPTAPTTTKKIQMIAGQLIRPYKTVIVVLTGILCILISVAGYFAYQSTKTVHKLKSQYANAIQEIEKNRGIMSTVIAQLTESVKKEHEAVKKQQTEIQKFRATSKAGSVRADYNSLIGSNKNSVYLIIMERIQMTRADGQVIFDTRDQNLKAIGTGSGFVIEGNKLITARHVIEPWFFTKNQEELVINALLTKGNNVSAQFLAISPDGERIEFTDRDVRIDRRFDQQAAIADENGKKVAITLGDLRNDWAYILLPKSIAGKGLMVDRELSNNLKQGQELLVLGYTYDISAGDYLKGEDISPFPSTAMVASDGLKDNLIRVSNLAFDSGNSGGPVFAIVANKLIVVGIVSWQYGKMHGRVGGVVPISIVK